jgi:nitrogen-specific signal transduction histidine kinase
MGFLDASKAEGGESQQLATSVALNAIITEVARQQTVDLRSNDLTVDLRLDPNLPEIPGDAAQLERVFWNLMSQCRQIHRGEWQDHDFNRGCPRPGLRQSERHRHWHFEG